MLKDQILSGQLKGGMKIPEESLAEQFGVSRTPIREAIRRLAEYGLVTIKPRMILPRSGFLWNSLPSIQSMRNHMQSM
jgi:DNA-binding GntR family transcriptional regulator